MTRLWHIATRTKHAAGLDREVARADADEAAPATQADTADAVPPPESAVAVTVVPGFDSPAPKVWIRNDGASEITDLVVTHEPSTGEPAVLEAPSPRLLPGEACVVALGEGADGKVLVAGTARREGEEPLAVEAVAAVPAAAVPDPPVPDAAASDAASPDAAVPDAASPDAAPAETGADNSKG
jgi:hypothetical protein